MLNAPQTALVINQSSLFTFKNYRHQMMYENWLEGQYGYRRVIDDNTSSSAGSSLSEMTFSPKMLAKNSHFLACLVFFSTSQQSVRKTGKVLSKFFCHQNHGWPKNIFIFGFSCVTGVRRAGKTPSDWGLCPSSGSGLDTCRHARDRDPPNLP